MNLKGIAGIIWQYFSLWINTIYDLHRYFRYSASKWRTHSDEQLMARILQKTHSIEKGLAMPTIRPGFGVSPLLELEQMLTEFESRQLDRTEVAFISASHAISAYFNYHDSSNLPTAIEVESLRKFAALSPNTNLGGAFFRNSEDTHTLARGDFRTLLQARRSVRMFDDHPPNLASIYEAIEFAGRSPSVCNRQGCRVTIVTDPKLLSAILKIQGGNRGFSEEIPSVLIVTSKLGIFRGARERNQGWIDGGLFSMTLLYSLTYLGLGSCPLNWSATARQDKLLRSTVNIPADENVIMLIAAGNLRQDFRIASSARLDLNSLVSHHYH
ncbi:nitroreductase family protein [Hydrogenophaga sp. ZJX-1]|uniref:nitroreductase family protein n=1 Tax=Hydrogenophaga sp. ZJX-1 TaxID=3404778 RepID=UPI003B288F39